jgi:hypothetical protein
MTEGHGNVEREGEGPAHHPPVHYTLALALEVRKEVLSAVRAVDILGATSTDLQTSVDFG